MKLSKSLMLAASLAIVLANPIFAAQTKMTSAEIGTLATIAAIDKNEILVSVVATSKKVSSDVADFANMMIKQHGSNLNDILEMAGAMHVASLTGGEADKMAAAGKKDMMTLGALDGDKFDAAYINAMVSGHTGALNLIDKQLMKTAKSDEMKKFLTDTRAVVAEHLEHAKKIQADMKTS